MSKENGDLGDVFEMAMKASYYYQQQGSSGSASLLLNKVADMLQQTDPQSSVKLLKEASKVSEVQILTSVFQQCSIKCPFLSIVF